jgi:ankyrin repeat protein
MAPLAANAVDEVFQAVGDDDVDKVTRLLDADPNLVKATAWSFNKTLLMHAAERGQGDMVGLLLAREAGVNLRDMFEDTALHYAAQFGHEGVVSLLLDGGSDVRNAGFAGLTALMLASVRGHAGAFRVLLERMGRRGLDERSANGSTALLLACVNGRMEPVQALLEAGADHSIPNDLGQTPEQIARKYGRRDCARFLEVSDSSFSTPCSHMHERCSCLTHVACNQDAMWHPCVLT